jgi:hypothetical protein
MIYRVQRYIAGGEHCGSWLDISSHTTKKQAMDSIDFGKLDAGDKARVVDCKGRLQRIGGVELIWTQGGK